MEKNILYKVIIYRDVKKIEIYKKTEELVYDNYYETDGDMFKVLINKTHDCKNIDQIEIIYK